MRIILLSFLVLFNYSSLVTSCPSSGDGDCVPSTDTYNQGANQSSYQTFTEIPSMNTSSNYNIDEIDSGLPDDYIPKKTSYLKEINEKSYFFSIAFICYTCVICMFIAFYSRIIRKNQSKDEGRKSKKNLEY